MVKIPHWVLPETLRDRMKNRKKNLMKENALLPNVAKNELVEAGRVAFSSGFSKSLVSYCGSQ